MRTKIFISAILFFVAIAAYGIDYTQFFTDKACRVDFQFSGNANSTLAFSKGEATLPKVCIALPTTAVCAPTMPKVFASFAKKQWNA